MTPGTYRSSTSTITAGHRFRHTGTHALFNLVVASFPRPFPPELRAACLELLDPRDLFNYSMACRAFNAEANRIRWRDYVFWFRPEGFGLDDACRPILRDPERARCIKSFTILMAHPLPSSTPSSRGGTKGGRVCRRTMAPWTSDWSMFSAALSMITSVTKFTLGESSSPRCAPFRMLGEPILVQFLTCIQVWMAAMTGIHTFTSRLDLARTVPLLSACPSLTQVALHCGWELSSSASSRLVAAEALPNLEEFEGDVLAVVTVVAAGAVVLRGPGSMMSSSFGIVRSLSGSRLGLGHVSLRPRLRKLSVYLSWPSRTFGDVLRQLTSLTTLRILQPPCHTTSMGDRLRHIGPLPSVQRLEYAYAYSDEPEPKTHSATTTTSSPSHSDDSSSSGSSSSCGSSSNSGTLARGEVLSGVNITDVLAPVSTTFTSLRSCLLDCHAHPDDNINTGFTELLRDGPPALARLCANGDFAHLEVFTWNMGPGRKTPGDRMVEFTRGGDGSDGDGDGDGNGNSWSASSWVAAGGSSSRQKELKVPR